MHFIWRTRRCFQTNGLKQLLQLHFSNAVIFNSCFSYCTPVTQTPDYTLGWQETSNYTVSSNASVDKWRLLEAKTQVLLWKTKLAQVKKADLGWLTINPVRLFLFCLPYHSFTLTIERMYPTPVHGITLIWTNVQRLSIFTKQNEVIQNINPYDCKPVIVWTLCDSSTSKPADR